MLNVFRKYSMVIGDEVMCDCIAPNDKEARKMLGEKAMDIFRESTFIIQVTIIKIPLI